MMLQNLMSMMAAIVSSSGRISVGPKQTPKLATVILFRSCSLETLLRRRLVNTYSADFMTSFYRSPLVLKLELKLNSFVRMRQWLYISAQQLEILHQGKT